MREVEAREVGKIIFLHDFQTLPAENTIDERPHLFNIAFLNLTELAKIEIASNIIYKYTPRHVITQRFLRSKTRITRTTLKIPTTNT